MKEMWTASKISTALEAFVQPKLEFHGIKQSLLCLIQYCVIHPQIKAYSSLASLASFSLSFFSIAPPLSLSLSPNFLFLSVYTQYFSEYDYTQRSAIGVIAKRQGEFSLFRCGVCAHSVLLLLPQADKMCVYHTK